MEPQAVSLALLAESGRAPCPACGKPLLPAQLPLHLKGPCRHLLPALTQLPAAAAPPPRGVRLACPAPDCTHASPTLKALRKHFQSKHARRSAACATCGRTFGRTDTARKHERQCGVAADPSCACACAPGKPFRRWATLQAHIARGNAAGSATAGAHAAVGAGAGAEAEAEEEAGLEFGIVAEEAGFGIVEE